MKHLKYLLLLLFIVLFTPNAYAYTYDVTNNITSPRGGASTGGRYLALEIYNSGSQNVYSVNTRYNGTLSNIEFNLPLPAAADECFTTNMEYTITMEMASSDWRNHFARPYVGADSSSTNWATSNVTFVSQKKIYFKFKIPAEESLCYGFVYVRLNSTSVSNTAFTGVTNWNLSKISLTDQYSSSGGGSSGGSTPPTPTPNPNQNIIDNDNQNTENIIENNNQNTQQIIDNQNQNNQVCKIHNLNSVKTSNKLLNANGQEIENSYFGISDYLYITNNTTIQVAKVTNQGDYACFYTTSKSVISCIQQNTLTVNQFITIPENATYFRFTVNTYEDIPNYKICDNANQVINDYLSDDSEPSIADNDFLTMFNSIGINDPLSYLLTLPVQLINKIVSLSNSCTPINLGTLYGTMITLPCINLENILGTSVWNIIDIVFSVSLLVVILKNLYDTFSNLLTMGAEKEAKEKFSMPTPMDFLAMILGGDK